MEKFKLSSIRFSKRILSASAVVLLLGFSPAYAATLSDSTVVRTNFSPPLGDVDQSSYDGQGYEAFKPFEAYTSNEVLAVNSFNGLMGGSNLEVTMLSEIAAFDGRNKNFANNFGVLDSDGNFVSILDSADANPGDFASIFQGADEDYTFALQSPEALFSSLDSQNQDQSPHILAQEVVRDGEVTVHPSSLRSDQAIKFQLLAGDIILYLEDMLSNGNLNFLDVPFAGDFDYNDMVLVVRQTQEEVPEPATLLLFGTALLGLPKLRKRQA